MKRTAIIGASGYAGRELQRILRGHQELEVDLLMTPRPDHVPPAPELPVEPLLQPLDIEALSNVDGVFLCAPNGVSAPLAQAALERGCKVVDLSADFRLKDRELYERTYGCTHPCPELLEEAVYGLTEQAREEVASARLVANPGCYPISILLPLMPLLQGGLLAQGEVIVADAKSGVSGAGKQPTGSTIYGRVHENCRAYHVGQHRHAPEIWQQAGTDCIRFVAHLLPAFRGILSTLYVVPTRGTGRGDVMECLHQAYAPEPFVRLYDSGLPELASVQRTNFCDIGVAALQDRIVLVAAIDNLVKGAAGQAVQNMNLMLGLEETGGLLDS